MFVTSFKAALVVAGVAFILIETRAQIIFNVNSGGPISDAISATPDDISVTTTFLFDVAGVTGIIGDINARTSIAHTFDSDLTAVLISPSGTSVTLFDIIGGNGENFQDTVLDDSAPTYIRYGDAPFIGSYKPHDDFHGDSLSDFNGQNPNGQWRLDITDHISGDSGILYKAGETAPWGTAIGTQLEITAVPELRFIFYNQSAFDGNDASANAGDDGAIATDKTALLPGQTATFANYTSYSRGINGVMVDIASLPGTPAAGDFAFKVGNDNTPSGWSAAPAPTSISVRSGAGVNGSDRVTLIWANNAIQKKWLQITVKATAATGLAADDVFYFGNAIGEPGNDPSNAIVNVTDVALTRANPRSPINPAAITFPYDYDRDGLVNVTDTAICRANQTSPITALSLISVP